MTLDDAILRAIFDLGPIVPARCVVATLSGEHVSASHIRRRLTALAVSRRLEALRGRGYMLTPSSENAVLRRRLGALEGEVAILVEKVDSLLPLAADASTTAIDIQAAMMDLDPVERDLYDRLRLARNAMAEALGISSYQLGQNRALRMLADMRTADPELIVGIVPGMTPKTWARIGQTYVAVIERFLAQQRAISASGPTSRNYEIPD